MPEKLPVDREFVKALYLQGLKTTEISEKTGVKLATLGQWICRYGWNKLLTKTKQELVKQSGAALSLEIARDMQAESKLLREELSSELHDQVKSLRAKPVNYKDLPGKYGRASTTLTIANTAAKVFGWDSQSGRSVVNIGTLNNLKVDGFVNDSSETVANPSRDNSETIDV